VITVCAMRGMGIWTVRIIWGSVILAARNVEAQATHIATTALNTLFSTISTNAFAY
jgi:hypothetical protein